MTPAGLEDLDRQMTRIACQAVIHQAAAMLKAEQLSNADGYMTMGADGILCRPDESIATAAERYAYQQHCCCRDLGIPRDDLTLLDCISWICRDSDDDEDTVSIDEVLAVAGLGSTTTTFAIKP